MARSQVDRIQYGLQCVTFVTVAGALTSQEVGAANICQDGSIPACKGEQAAECGWGPAVGRAARQL
jgi:hypothetical protein